ncbi:MAG: hypothetical protein Q9187_001105 [Circinaria calcarea]
MTSAYFTYILLPPLPIRWTPQSCLEYTVSFVLSPLTVFTLWNYVSNVNANLSRYASAMLPRPDNPDVCSIKGTTPQSSFYDSVTGLESSNGLAKSKGRTNATLFSEVKKDMTAAFDTVFELGANVTHRIKDTMRIVRNQIASAKIAIPNSGQEGKTDMMENQLLPASGPSAEGPPRQDSARNIERHELRPMDAAAPSLSTATPSPASSVSDEEENMTLVLEPSTNVVQITTRTGSTDTLHMNVEFAPVAGVPVYTSSFSASPRPAVVETVLVQEVDGSEHDSEALISTNGKVEPHHRVTALTTYAADCLGQHLAWHMSDFICLPLEALYVRSIALAFLAASGPSPLAPRLGTADIYPKRSWFGLGLRASGLRGIDDYMGKMVLCLGIEMVVQLGVWQIGTGIAWWAGKQWFRWGKL